MIVVEATTVITDSIKASFDAMGMQILSFPLIIVATYFFSFLALRLKKMPKSIAKPISSLVTFSGAWLFLSL